MQKDVPIERRKALFDALAHLQADPFIYMHVSCGWGSKRQNVLLMSGFEILKLEGSFASDPDFLALKDKYNKIWQGDKILPLSAYHRADGERMTYLDIFEMLVHDFNLKADKIEKAENSPYYIREEDGMENQIIILRDLRRGDTIIFLYDGNKKTILIKAF